MNEGENGGEDDTTVDRLLGGQLALRQLRRGHRVGTDAVLLAAAADVAPGERFIDVGAGVGAVGLALALRERSASGVLVDVDAAAIKLADENIARNGLTQQVSAVRLDILDRRQGLASGLVGTADLVVTNPPYHHPGRVRDSPDESRAAAHVLSAAVADPLGDWIKRACALLKPNGRLVMIHRPEALPALLPILNGRLGDIVLRFIHPKAEAPARRVIVAGRHGSRAPMTICSQLTLHGPDGQFTAESRAHHAGAPMCIWSKESRPRRAGQVR